MKLSLERIAIWTAAELPGDISRADLEASGYSIDSRTIAPGEVFFAVRGERFDGHDFVEAALDRGAVAAVVSRSSLDSLPQAVREKPFLIVDHNFGNDGPLLALQTLAAAVRRHWGGLVVAITGSAGKTTTKEAIAAVLATRFKVLKSEGNLNNGFGLPLQLLRLEPDDQIAVIEMGMNHAGEIAALAKIAAPNWGVVTNVGWAHAENFPESISGIARGDPYVSQFGREFHGKTISFGSGPCAEPHAEDIVEEGQQGSSFRVSAGEESAEVHLSLMGRHNVTNAMAAIAVGLEAGIPLGECVTAVEALRAGSKRGQVRQIRGATIIDDCYNSNPEALKSMIVTLASISAKRRILVAGEMLELGKDAADLHRACGDFAAKQGIDVVLGVRGLAIHLVDGAAESGAAAVFVESPELAAEWLRASLREGDAVLLKASRGVQLERAIAALDAAK
jgi:UDP-N-acetylmuramoyl-tripeptide--D-alanyl-D-alanine ligase